MRRASMLTTLIVLLSWTQADADPASGCPEVPPGAAVFAPSDSHVEGYRVDQLVIDVTAEAIRPLVDLIDVELVSLAQLRVCVVGDPRPVPAGAAHVTAEASGGDWTVTLAVHPIPYVPADDLGGWLAAELSGPARLGVVHVALWQVSDGAYPEALAADVAGWYLARLSPPIDWRSGGIVDTVAIDPTDFEAGSGSFAGFAAGSAGMRVIADPELSALDELARRWRQPIGPNRGLVPGGLGVWLSALALMVSLVALIAVRRRGKRIVMPTVDRRADARQPRERDSAVTRPTPSGGPTAVVPVSAPLVPPQLGRASIAASSPSAPPEWQDRNGHGLAMDNAYLNGTTVLGTSMIGHHARHNGKPCQDAFAVSQAQERFIVAAVCDGVGSLPLSHLAAETAASVATRELATQLGTLGRLEEVDASRVVHQINIALQNLYADGHGVETKDLATTLLALVVDTLAPAGQMPLYAARIGDCELWALGAQGWIDLFAPSVPIGPSAFVDCGTGALPDENIQPAEILCDWPTETRLVLAMTDGVWRSMRDGESVRRSFAQTLASPPPPLEFAAMVGFVRQGANDDRTAVAVWRPS